MLYFTQAQAIFSKTFPALNFSVGLLFPFSKIPVPNLFNQINGNFKLDEKLFLHEKLILKDLSSIFYPERSIIWTTCLVSWATLR